MRIAVLATNRNPLSTPYAGGQESLTAALVEGFRARGHDVVLYAAAGTPESLADEVIVYPELPRLSEVAALDPQIPEKPFLREHHAFTFAMAHLAARYDIDVMANHSLHHLPLSLSPVLAMPVVTTLHTPPFPWMELGAALAAPTARYVAVSKAVAAQWSTLTDVKVVSNAADPNVFRYGAGSPALAWVGRITPEKEPHLAIAVARRTGRPLRLIGPVADEAYFAEAVAPHLAAGEYLGPLAPEALAEAVGASYALLVTPVWDEPFGLVAAEAALCGTPVVALDRGGVGGGRRPRNRCARAERRRPERCRARRRSRRGRRSGGGVRPVHRARCGPGVREFRSVCDGAPAGARRGCPENVARADGGGSMRPLVIGYYVHHHGRGHATRAGVIGAVLMRRGHHVTYLGSGALPEGDAVALAPDNDEADAPFVDATARGRLHWAPLGRGGYRTRATQLADWVARANPDVVVDDVSVEVTVLLRSLGVPMVVVAQPGARDDAPHELAYDLAAAILAPWPPGLDVAPHLARWRTKVACVGGVSRFAQGRPVHDGYTSRKHTSPKNAALLVGGEGWDDPDLPEQIIAARPDLTWQQPRPGHPVEDVLAAADVVATHAGQNALADVACSGVPAVVVPQQRPFDEQADMARALEAAGVTRSVPLGASGAQVAAAVDTARGDWDRWEVDGAPERACAVIERAVLRTTVVTPIRGRLDHLVN